MNANNKGLTLKGNGHWIPIITGYELTGEELLEFDYLDDPINDFTGFKYRGDAYDLSNIMRHNETINGVEFHGIVNYTIWSGILIQIADSGDAVKVYYYWSGI